MRAHPPCTGDAPRAFEKATRRAAVPDVILLNLKVPEMDGFEFVSKLRQSDAWQKIPVIVITAKTLTAADRERLNGQVERLIQKAGHKLDSLLASLDEMLPKQPRRSGLVT